jgi:hypothetical protein
MRHRYLMALLLCTVLMPPARATTQEQNAGPNLAANAAIKYWTAFALLPNLDTDQEKLLEGWNNVPLDAAALKLIEMSRGSREYLHRGAKLPRCDWGLDYEDGLNMPVPHISRSRTMARLAALHARHEFEQGHWSAGADDVISLLRLARHVETDSIMIAQMAGYMIEATAIDAAAPYLLKAQPALPAALTTALEALPARPTPSEVILKEKSVLSAWLLQRLKDAGEHENSSWRSILWVELPSVQTPQQALKMTEDMGTYLDRLALQAAGPWNKFITPDSDFYRNVKRANPLAASLLPAMISCVDAEHRVQTRVAMLRAALAVVRGGPEALKDIKDPASTGSFEYRVLDGGFELRSKLQQLGKPVALTVGHGKG